MNQHFFAPGKLLLSGEYAVLKGAKAIAAPTAYGQHLEVKSNSGSPSHWLALDEQNNSWLDFDLTEARSEAELLVAKILEQAWQGNIPKNQLLTTRLDFPRKWGLGSSSTFLALIAKWSNFDPWPLFFNNLKGSGYDLAIALEEKALQYQLNDKTKPSYQTISLPEFFNETLFIYLGQKQNSAQEVKRFQRLQHNTSAIEEISKLSEQLLHLNDSKALGDWMSEHEARIGELIALNTINEKRFSGLDGAIKSLGAWGGDFAWYAGPADKSYFHRKGYDQVFRFSELIKTI